MSLPTNHHCAASLDEAAIGDKLLVARVHPSKTSTEWERWLEEIGFLPGERVELMARGFPGGDPLVVRVGQSTFALRRAEAACIEVTTADAAALTYTGLLRNEGRPA